MPSRGMPASSSWRISGCRNSPLGTGLVMSQIRMQAVRLPRASSPSGGMPTGRASALATSPTGSASTGMACLWITVGSQPAGGFTASTPRP